jgi:hypothetical protein
VAPAVLLLATPAAHLASGEQHSTAAWICMTTVMLDRLCMYSMHGAVVSKPNSCKRMRAVSKRLRQCSEVLHHDATESLLTASAPAVAAAAAAANFTLALQLLHTVSPYIVLCSY